MRRRVKTKNESDADGADDVGLKMMYGADDVGLKTTYDGDDVCVLMKRKD
jgi:hypothetical protein